MESAEIRRRFLAYFDARDHAVVPSAPLVADDPELLFVVAGMQPFKPYFRGDLPAPWPRAASVQKCVRTPDIEEVGRTTRHATFFQMCGNFSFGDYFKERAIPLAWELLTTPVADGGYGFPGDRLWATVYLDDDEAADIWQRVVGLPAARIQRRGMVDNFWSMGVAGPAGPCSEIYVDRGPAYGAEGGPAADEERYLEVWNLVFMQYERGPGGAKDGYPILGELPAKNIDTGMGLERMATLLQGVDNLYEIDTSRAVLDRAGELSGHRYGTGDADGRADVALRVIADHTRTAVMLIGDGVTPGNEARGYVLRRLVRRAVRNMRLLGAHDPALGELVDTAIAAMGPQYPELLGDQARIRAVAVAEEASFLETLRAGTQIFDLAVRETRAAGGHTLPGDRVFALHDTYGFPVDLTLEMAAEAGLSVDEEGFRRLMAEQRARAQADAAARKTAGVDLGAYRDLWAASGGTEFTGYATVRDEATVRGLLVGGAPAPAAGAGAEVELVLDRTPFYAEAGGQLADQGVIRVGEALVEVYDVQRPLPDLVVHRARVVAGEVQTGATAYAEVDVARRRAISRSHTATHLVHRALRRALGETATQAGSENAPGRFRFDFRAVGAVPAAALADVEAEVNAVLLDDLPVRAYVTSQEEARRQGALALFGERYGDQVRVVEVGDYSRELCGGTHTARSAQLGLVKLLGESSIGAGIRRVEALVGTDAFTYLAREHTLLAQLGELLRARPDELPDRVAAMVARLREAEKELDRLRAGALLAGAGELAGAARDVAGVSVVTHLAPEGTGAEDLRRLAVAVRGQWPGERPGVVALGAAAGGRPALVVAVTDAARDRGLRAGALVQEAAAAVGGRGGGRDDLAQGGGGDATGLPEALRRVAAAVDRLAATG